jgi:hypothetical protein
MDSPHAQVLLRGSKYVDCEETLPLEPNLRRTGTAGERDKVFAFNYACRKLCILKISIGKPI